MADHIDQTPPTEATKDEIEEGTKVDHSIVEIQETIGQDLSVLQTKKSVNQIFDERFKELGNSSAKSTTIFKVNVGLSKTNPAAYTPILISIGPYYHNKSPNFHPMEKYKLLYLRRFLNRIEEIDAESCMRELEKLKEKALMCYDDIENLEVVADKFSEIMLLDGCFLVEFIRESFKIRPEGEKDYQPIIDNPWIISQVHRDMVVLENQLPYFVLDRLHVMTLYPNEPSFLDIVTHALFYTSPKRTLTLQSIIDNKKPIDHLLHVLHMVLGPSEMINSRQRTDASKKKGFCNINSFFGKIFRRMKRSKKSPYSPSFWRSPSATELYEAGVSFKGVAGDDKDIKFENGLLEISCFIVEDSTETLLRNLIAYEHYSSKVYPYFSEYVGIMDQLINSPKDVQLLRESGIIINFLGDDKAVAKIFNKLGEGVVLFGGFYYMEECSKLNQHCQKRWNITVANLKHTYFHSLWAGTSTLAAIVLLILTTIQTVLAFTGSVK